MMMKFPFLIACFFIPSLASEVEQPNSEPFRCDYVPMELPQPDSPQFARPHLFQVEQPFVPYNVLFLIDERIDPVDLTKVVMATKYANEKLSKSIKARKLVDVRYENHQPECKEMCGYAPFPPEFILPCPMTSKPEASDQIKKLNEANYTLVVRALVRDQGVVANKQMFKVLTNACAGKTIAFARGCDFTLTDIDHGPHHGFFFICEKPSKLSDEALRAVVLHETLHILMPYSLSGVAATYHDCWNLDQCKDTTWKEVKRQMKIKNQEPVEITNGIAIGRFMQKAAQAHFGCDTAEGVELNFKINLTTMEVEINHAHWSEHLFPDELMAPVQATTSRFSLLTLSALASHARWYKVDLSKAERLVSSKPSEEFACDMAHKDCFEIVKAQSGKGVKFIRPYCDVRKGTDRVIASHCSPDHKRQLRCVNHVGNSGCAFLMGFDDKTYDHELCANTTSAKNGSLASKVSASFGSGTICVTTTSFAPSEIDKTNALCLHHECLEDSLILKSKPVKNDDADCYITCPKSQSNLLLTFNWCNNTKHKTTIICPDYAKVCEKETTTTAATSTVPKTTSAIPSTTSSVPKPSPTTAVAASGGIQSFKLNMIWLIWYITVVKL